ncbi:hypothetical protein BV20DRAFT_76239 [Pilatotrama ljubarskyi]|nr:hypothetical protein BV20DRAFT_76239 [Pilatotrama ljubarskyi]
MSSRGAILGKNNQLTARVQTEKSSRDKRVGLYDRAHAAQRLKNPYGRQGRPLYRRLSEQKRTGSSPSWRQVTCRRVGIARTSGHWRYLLALTELGFLFRPRKENLPFDFGGVTGSIRWLGTGIGGGCESVLVFGSWRPRSRSEMSEYDKRVVYEARSLRGGETRVCRLRQRTSEGAQTGRTGGRRGEEVQIIYSTSGTGGRQRRPDMGV